MINSVAMYIYTRTPGLYIVALIRALLSQHNTDATGHMRFGKIFIHQKLLSKVAGMKSKLSIYDLLTPHTSKRCPNL